MIQNLSSILIKSKILDQYLANDQSLRQLLEEIEHGDGSSQLSSIVEMKTPVSASELLPIYQRRIRLMSDSQHANKFSISTLIRFCEDQPDTLIKTLTITSKQASYHTYFHVSGQSFIPVCVIVGKPIPKEIG
jgi:hypothetical protein